MSHFLLFQPKLLHFFQDTSDRERTESCLLYPPTLNNKNELWTETGTWIWTRPDPTRTTQPVRTGCCLKGRIREKNRGNIAHTRAASEPEGTQP